MKNGVIVKPYNIMIGTPAYGGMVHTDYIWSVLPLRKNGVNYEIAFIGNQSLITRARNELFSLFVSSDYDKYSHLFFLDADIGIKPEGVKRLLDHDKPLIAAPVPLKGISSGGKPFFNVGEILEEQENSLVTVDSVGTAVMCIRKDLALEVKEWAIENKQVYHRKGHSLLNNVRQEISGEFYNVFDVGIFDDDYLSEDFYFCRLARELGHKVYVDVSIPTRHNGNYVFTS